MKKLYIILWAIIGVIISVPFVVMAGQISVPSSPAQGWTLSGLLSGNYQATSSLFISPIGSVGIASTTPASLFTVNGNSYLDGLVGIGGAPNSAGSLSIYDKTVTGSPLRLYCATAGTNSCFTLFDGSVAGVAHDWAIGVGVGSIATDFSIVSESLPSGTENITFSDSGYGTTTLKTGFTINNFYNSTSTSNVGFDISSGCYAKNGVCIGGGAGGGVSSVSGTWPIISSGGTTPAISFGWATTSQPSSSNLVVSNGTNGFYGVSTSTLSASSPLTGSFTQIGSGGAIGCQTASGSQAGCLSSTDWNTFNNKSSFPFTSLTNFNVAGVSTTTVVNFTNGLNASTTSQFANSSTTVASFINASTTNLFLNGQKFTSLLGTGLSNTAGVLSLTSNTISGITLGSNLNSHSTNSSLSGTSYNGSASVSDWGLNLSNANNWTSLQQFQKATSTNFDVINQLAVGSSVATTTIFGNATSTFGAGIAGTYLNLTGNSATSTASNGFNITAGCYSIAGVCLTSSGASLTGLTNQVAYFSGTNTAVGTSTITILPSGNVGIGTTTPNTKFQVYDATGITTFTGLQNQGVRIDGGVAVGNYSLLGFSRDADPYKGNNLAQIGSQFNAAGSSLFFGTSNSYSTGITNTALTIDPSGNVGIGTTSPLSRLEVAGTDTVLRVSGQTATNQSVVRFTTGGTNRWDVGVNDNLGSNGGTLEFSQSGATPNMVILNSGNVGIGTTSPYALLSVGNTSGIGFTIATSTFNSTGGINLQSGGCFAIAGTCIGGGGGAGTINSGTTNNLPYYSGATTLSDSTFLTINTTAQNLGIGTTTPNFLGSLDIASATPAVFLTDTNAGVDSKHWGLFNTDGAFSIGTSSDSETATSSAFSITPVSVSQWGFGSSTPFADFAINPVAGGAALQFAIGSSSATSFDISNRGFVGVGTTSPFAVFSLANSIASTPVFAVSTSTGTSGTPNFEIDKSGHPIYSGPKPTCDANCTMSAGNDARFRVILGVSKTTSTITFANSWGNIAPICGANEGTAGTVTVNASSTPTTVVLTALSSLTTVDVDVRCDGIQ